jgi:hypothetical protein
MTKQIEMGILNWENKCLYQIQVGKTDTRLVSSRYVLLICKDGLMGGGMQHVHLYQASQDRKN